MVSVDEALSSVGGFQAHNTLIFEDVPLPGLTPSTAITGNPNSPPTPANSNDPGLNTGTGGIKAFMSSKWKWILGILAVLLALWYFGAFKSLSATPA